MEMRKIATRSLAPALAMSAAAVGLPATASALPRGTDFTSSGSITKSELEAKLRAKTGVGPDLCAHECDGNWGAYSHADTDADRHYSRISEVFCSDVNPGAGRYENQWYCEGYGDVTHHWHLYLSPYGYSYSPYFP
jgi:hypothetical protein